jgi:uncharacterized SAM-binding protein YcdF (DUF218 family)
MSPTRKRRSIVLLSLVFSTWTILAWLLDHHGNRTTETGSFDAIVVLGCGVRPDGSAGRALAARTERAVELFHQGLAPRLVLTGGIGEHGPSEAQVAATIARNGGVPASALVLEDRSHSTHQNAEFTMALIGANQNILIVSDRYHAFRAERVFRKFFTRVSVVGSVGKPMDRIRGSFREVVAVIAYGLSGKI